MKRSLPFALLTLLIGSCSTPRENTPTVALPVCSVAATLSTPTSRIAISEDSDTKRWKGEWESDDALGGASLGCDITAFDLFEIDSYGTSSSSFTGSYRDADIRFVYPYNSTSAVEDDHYTVDLAEQQFDMEESFALLGEYTHFISSSAIDPTEQNSISMQHIGCAILLNIDFYSLYGYGESYQYKLERLEVGLEAEDAVDGDLLVATSKQINLSADVADDDFYSNPTMGILGVDICNSPYISPSTTYSVIFNSFPFAVAVGESLSLKFYLGRYDMEGTFVKTYYTKALSVTNTTADEILFSRATYNTINSHYDGSLYFSVSINAGLE